MELPVYFVFSTILEGRFKDPWRTWRSMQQGKGPLCTWEGMAYFLLGFSICAVFSYDIDLCFGLSTLARNPGKRHMDGLVWHW